MGSLFALLMSGILVIYLLNPTFGVDLIPDNLPILGNLDEAAATALLISCLSYFGVQLPVFRRRELPRQIPGEAVPVETR